MWSYTDTENYGVSQNNKFLCRLRFLYNTASCRIRIIWLITRVIKIVFYVMAYSVLRPTFVFTQFAYCDKRLCETNLINNTNHKDCVLRNIRFCSTQHRTLCYEQQLLLTRDFSCCSNLHTMAVLHESEIFDLIVNSCS